MRVPPRFRPGHARRGAAAIAAVQPALAKGLFRSMKLPDGRCLADIQWHELPKLAAEYRQFSRLFTLLHRKAVPPDVFATIDQVVKEADLRALLDEVERFNDIV